MTIQYFDTKGEAIAKIPEDHLGKCYVGTLTPIVREHHGKYYVVFYNGFGEYLGILQEDCTIMRENLP